MAYQIERLPMDAKRLLGTRGCRTEGCGVGVQDVEAQSVFGVIPVLNLLRRIGHARRALSQPGPDIEGHRRVPCARDSASE